MSEIKAEIKIDVDDIRREFLADNSILTRGQAIERIRDIRKGVQCEHLNPYFEQTLAFNEGAIRELMAIFDIKESEL